jgi:hypothetical protein
VTGSAGELASAALAAAGVSSAAVAAATSAFDASTAETLPRTTPEIDAWTERECAVKYQSVNPELFLRRLYRRAMIARCGTNTSCFDYRLGALM